MLTEYVALTILGICIVLFLTNYIPSSFVAILGCILMTACGCCEFSTAFSGFSSEAFFLIAGSMVVGVAMAETGFASWVAEGCMRLAKGNEKRFVLFSIIAGGILSAFIANTAVVACFLPVIESVAIAQKGDRKNMTMPIALGIMYGGSLTLVGSTPQPIADGLVSEMFGFHIGIYDFLGPGMTIFVTYVLYTMFVGYPLGIKIWGNREDINLPVESELDGNTKKTFIKWKIIAMFFVFMFMIICYSFSFMPTALTALIAGVLCIVLRLCTEQQVFKNMKWGPLFMLGGTIGIAAGLNASGAGLVLADGVLKLIGDSANPLVFFAAFVLLTTLISNFCSNAATVIMILPLVLPVCMSYGWNPVTFAVGIVLASNLTCATPISHTSVTMTLVAGYRFSDYIKYNGIMCIIVNLVIIFITPLFLPFVI